jgi:hypothetical protein
MFNILYCWFEVWLVDCQQWLDQLVPLLLVLLVPQLLDLVQLRDLTIYQEIPLVDRYWWAAEVVAWLWQCLWPLGLLAQTVHCCWYLWLVQQSQDLI